MKNARGRLKIKYLPLWLITVFMARGRLKIKYLPLWLITVFIELF